MTDKNEHFIDLSPINSSKSSHSDSFFSPHDPILFSFPKPEQTRLSLNEKPSVLLKSTYDASEPKIGFNPAFRVNFLRDLEKKGYSINKSKLSMNGRSENSTFLPLETPGKKKSSGEEREKEQTQVIHSLEDKLSELRRVSNFFERNYSGIQEDNKRYIQENSELKEKLFKMKEKLNKKSLVIKNLKEAETILKESFTTKIKEKEEQIEKLMNIISVLPDVYQEKIEETRKIPRSFHNEKNLEKEKKILKEMYNNINNLEIQKNVQKKIVKNSNFKQKKLSCDINAKFDFQSSIFDPKTTKNQEKFKENDSKIHPKSTKHSDEIKTQKAFF